MPLHFPNHHPDTDVFWPDCRLFLGNRVVGQAADSRWTTAGLILPPRRCLRPVFFTLTLRIVRMLARRRVNSILTLMIWRAERRKPPGEDRNGVISNITRRLTPLGSPNHYNRSGLPFALNFNSDRQRTAFRILAHFLNLAERSRFFLQCFSGHAIDDLAHSLRTSSRRPSSFSVACV